MVLDTHLDLPERLLKTNDDVGVRTAQGDFDYVRAREGGLGAMFCALYVPAVLEGSEAAWAHAERLLAATMALAERWPDRFMLVRRAADIPDVAPGERIRIALGLENGAPLLGRLERVATLHALGIRYITLTHMKANHLCDSSGDPARPWHGLSPFGKEVVREMNRLGMMVDVSHASDEAFWNVLDGSRVPVIASHSSCRAFTPGWERNMDDAMIRALAERRGTVQVNFGSTFLRADLRAAADREFAAVRDFRARGGHAADSDEAKEFSVHYRRDHPRAYAEVADVARHIDHIAEIAGIDHVGIGSDFEGLGDQLPAGLKDVSMYPALIAELVGLGFSRTDITKICSGNLLRVWREVEEAAEK